jgi:hypothetical protein
MKNLSKYGKIPQILRKETIHYFPKGNKKYFQLNGNDNTTYHILWGAANMTHLNL